MAIELVDKYLPYVDEQFSTESKMSLVTNQDFKFTGAHSVRVYKMSTSAMNDYGRVGSKDGVWSRYGKIENLDATTEQFIMKNDRSFTFVIDKMDEDETGETLEAASALARQMREVVIPEVDAYTYGVMCEGAGSKPEAVELTPENIYMLIIEANSALDNAEVPETNRVLIVTPDTYLIMKKCKDIVMETDIGQEMRARGVIANLDGLNVQKIPAKRLPEGFGFMIAHPCATPAPTKLENFKTHENPPGISGILVEGRVVYDAFVLPNKKKALYYQRIPVQGE